MRKKFMKPSKILVILIMIIYPIYLFANDTDINEIDMSPDDYALQLIDSAIYHSKIDVNKAYSFINEAIKLNRESEDSTKVKIYAQAAKLCYDIGLYPMSLDCLFKEYSIQSEIDSLQTIQILYYIGNVYVSLNDLGNARLYCTKAIAMIERNHFVISNPSFVFRTYDGISFGENKVYNQLAIIERKDKNFIKAKELIIKSLDYSIQEKDTLINIRSLQTLTDICFDLHDSVGGNKYLEQAINLCLKSGKYRELAIAYQTKAKILYNEDSIKNRDEVIDYLLKSYNISSKNMDLPITIRETTYMLYSIYKSMGDFQKALYYRNINVKLLEDAVRFEAKKRLSSVEANAAFRQYSKQWREEQHRKKIIMYSIVIFACLLSVVLFLVYRLQRSKMFERKLQNDILEKKLEFKNKEFTSKVMQIVQITKILDETYREIQNITKTAPEDVQNNLSPVINNLKHNKNNLNWDEFEKLFIETNDNFYKRLITDYPDLTKNELRLCAFLKMNLTTKEISSITNHSERSIIMARSRLRKKLNLDTEKGNLTNLLLKYGDNFS